MLIFYHSYKRPQKIFISTKANSAKNINCWVTPYPLELFSRPTWHFSRRNAEGYNRNPLTIPDIPLPAKATSIVTDSTNEINPN